VITKKIGTQKIIAGEAPTMRNSSPSKLAQMLAIDRVFFREFQISQSHHPYNDSMFFSLLDCYRTPGASGPALLIAGYRQMKPLLN
jgi:hypothetical protein